MPRSAQRRDDAREVVAEAGEHEVAVARPEADASPRERVVEQPLRLAHLLDIPVAVLAVLDRRRQRARRRRSACRAGPPGASAPASPACRPARRCAARPARTLWRTSGPTTRFGIRPERRVARSSSRPRSPRRPRRGRPAPAAPPRRPRRSRCAGSSRPVGLFGLVRKMMRVRGVIAAVTRSQRKDEVRPGGTSTIRPPSGVGARRVHVERRLRRRSPRTGRRPARRAALTSDASMIPSSRPLVRTHVVGARRRSRRAAAHDRVVVGIDRRRPAASASRSAASTAGEQPAVFSLRCSRRPAVRRRDALVLVAHDVDLRSAAARVGPLRAAA